MSIHSERTPLLDGGPSNGNGRRSDTKFNHSLSQRTAALLKGEGEPSWLESYRYFWRGDWSNILLIFVPLSFISHHLNWDAALRFSFSLIAILPLAKLFGKGTEQISIKLGETVFGPFYACFGSAVEIIVGVAALLQDEIRVVQTSMLGSILSNLLLVLGCSFFAGLKYRESNFRVTAAQAASSLMTLACLTLAIPAAYNSFKDTSSSTQGLLIISHSTALLLLGVYIAYLFFQLKTHKKLFFVEQVLGGEEEEEVASMSVVAAGSALLIVTVITSFCADYLVASIEETATRYHISKPFIGLILIPIVANAAYVTSVWMALTGRMELTIGICVGSSIQIASFVIPLLVIVGWVTGHELTLFFTDFETIVLFLSVLLVNLLVKNGKSNYMEGLMLITLYLVIAISFWVSG